MAETSPFASIMDYAVVFAPGDTIFSGTGDLLIDAGQKQVPWSGICWDTQWIASKKHDIASQALRVIRIKAPTREVFHATVLNMSGTDAADVMLDYDSNTHQDLQRTMRRCLMTRSARHAVGTVEAWPFDADSVPFLAADIDASIRNHEAGNAGAIHLPSMLPGTGNGAHD